ncbi:pyocin knob domain-containing protein [[Clostridium] symbiosum]|uniref:pyocin knob domain-containing protein n=1 Tax=Clostridium symbiosum TaxID=1512 RepID=UPI0034A14372
MQTIVYHSKARKTMCGMGTFCLIGMISFQLTMQNSDNFSTYRSFIGLDFNTIEKTGIYSDGSTPDTSGCKNYPVNITGLLFVLRTQYVCAQIYFTNDMTSLHVRARYLSNVWSGWRAFSLA